MARRVIQICAGMVLVAVLNLAPGTGIVAAEEPFIEPRTPPPNTINVIADALILRPLGLVMIPVTGLVYGISYPFARAAGNEEETYQSLLGNTIDFTFHRPMGRGEPFD